MKKKVLLSSVLTIALCMSLIAGSTFALFTNSSEVSIVVEAGKVEMTASIANVQLYSAEAKDGGSLVDENQNTYEHQPVSQFTNGGTAEFAGAVLTIDRITPGDKVTFNVTGTNTSNVGIQYRYVIECLDGYKLMSGLVFKVNDVEYKNLASYTSPWTALEVNKNIADKDPVAISIELPIDAGNEYQAQSTSIKVTVEAIQGNAVVDSYTTPIIVEIPQVSTPTDLAAALTDPEIPAINIIDDIDDELKLADDISNKTIYANGNDVDLVFTGKLENVVVSGIVADEAGCSINLKDVAEGSNITILDSTLISKSGSSNNECAIRLGVNANVTIDNCTFISGGGKTYSMYQSGATKGLTITNTTFKGFGSWAIQVNNAVNGDLVVENCTFEDCDYGLLKVLYTRPADSKFVFANNKVINCDRGHDGVYDLLYIKITDGATIDISGNVRLTVENGTVVSEAVWNPGSIDGVTIVPATNP